MLRFPVLKLISYDSSSSTAAIEEETAFAAHFQSELSHPSS